MEKSKVNSNSPSLQIYGRINFFFLNQCSLSRTKKAQTDVHTSNNYTCALMVNPFAVLCNIDLSRLSSALR